MRGWRKGMQGRHSREGAGNYTHRVATVKSCTWWIGCEYMCPYVHVCCIHHCTWMHTRAKWSTLNLHHNLKYMYIHIHVHVHVQVHSWPYMLLQYTSMHISLRLSTSVCVLLWKACRHRACQITCTSHNHWGVVCTVHGSREGRGVPKLTYIRLPHNRHRAHRGSTPQHKQLCTYSTHVTLLLNWPVEDPWTTYSFHTHTHTHLITATWQCTVQAHCSTHHYTQVDCSDLTFSQWALTTERGVPKVSAEGIYRVHVHTCTMYLHVQHKCCDLQCSSGQVSSAIHVHVCMYSTCTVQQEPIFGKIMYMYTVPILSVWLMLTCTVHGTNVLHICGTCTCMYWVQVYKHVHVRVCAFLPVPESVVTKQSHVLITCTCTCTCTCSLAHGLIHGIPVVCMSACTGTVYCHMVYTFPQYIHVHV